MDLNERFRTLVKLALVDDQLDESERSFIYQLAESVSFSEDLLNNMICDELEGKESSLDLNGLSFDDKISILVDLVKLMKADGKVLSSEVEFCEKVVKTLGFKEKAVGFLSAVVPVDSGVPLDESKIHFRMRKYLE